MNIQLLEHICLLITLKMMMQHILTVLVFIRSPQNIKNKNDHVIYFDIYGVKCISQKFKNLTGDKYI